VTVVTRFGDLGHCRACRKVSHGVINPGGTEPTRILLFPQGRRQLMYDTILISVAVILSLSLTYVGLYLALRPLRHEYRKPIVILLCFACSAVALMAAMYIRSKSG
jgi:hypothetical protein